MFKKRVCNARSLVFSGDSFEAFTKDGTGLVVGRAWIAICAFPRPQMKKTIKVSFAYMSVSCDSNFAMSLVLDNSFSCFDAWGHVFW